MNRLALASIALLCSAGVSATAASHGGAKIRKLDASQAPMSWAQAAKVHGIRTGGPRSNKKRRGLASGMAYGVGASGPFTHSRVETDPSGLYGANYNKTGRLVVTRNGRSYSCTGALIRPGLVVTAAHCLSEFGKKAAGLATAAEFRPGYNGWIDSQLGVWSASGIVVPDVHFNGTDTCTTNGRCNNDVGLVVLAANDGVLPGKVVGHYNHAVNGPTFKKWDLSSSYYKYSQITVLGYSNGFDYGKLLQRNDANAYLQTYNTINYATDSALSLGSDGGPWLINFGVKPTLSPGATLGSESDQYVVGVTQSYMNLEGLKTVYGTYFGVNKEYPSLAYGSYIGGNIAYLLNKTCSNAAFKAAC